MHILFEIKKMKKKNVSVLHLITIAYLLISPLFTSL